MESSKIKNESNFKALKWIFLRCRRYTLIVLLDALLVSVIAGGFIGLALISKEVLDRAVEGKGGLAFYAGLLVGIVILQVLLSSLNTLTKTIVSGKLVMAIREYLFKSICKKKYSEISAYHSGDLLTRITADSDTVVSGITNIIPTFFSLATRIVLGIWAVAKLNGWIILIVMAICFLVPIFSKNFLISGLKITTIPTTRRISILSKIFVITWKESKYVMR